VKGKEQPNKRRAISKGTRFSIFSRDGYQCRYCGRQSDVVELVIDHVIPVVQGGTNDHENLITACQECNAGKAAKTPTQSAPSETDRLRLAQEMREQESAAQAVARAAAARREVKQEMIDVWCDIRGTKEVDSQTIAVVTRYAEMYGPERVIEWIEIAEQRLHGKADYKLGMYISGIRRRWLEQSGFAPPSGTPESE
jgi:hypothetical protein